MSVTYATAYMGGANMTDLNLHIPNNTLAIDQLTQLDADHWFNTWLSWLCSELSQVRAGLLVSDESLNSRFQAQAVWPEATEYDSVLEQAAKETLRRQTPLITPLTESSLQIGSYPVFVESKLYAIITVLFEVGEETNLHQNLAIIEFCSGWLELRQSRSRITHAMDVSKRHNLVIESIAQVLEEPDFDHAALRFVNVLRRHLNAERVVLGFAHLQEVKIHAQSDSSGLSKKHQLVKLTTLALQETVDQQESVLWPASDASDVVTLAHQKLAEEEGRRSLLSVPLVDKELCYGAILFDRSPESPFTKEECQTAEALANFTGVVLEEKRQSNLPLHGHLHRSLRNQLARLLGPGYLGRKVTALCSSVVLLFLVFANGSYKIAADSVIEGAELRSIVVPFTGYLQKAAVRAGDSVNEGALLAELDTREYRLERISWISQQAAAKRQYEDALAKQERAQVQISNAQVQRAQAEIALLDFQIAQARMTAPFDALVVSGDLNQRIGSLVKQGEVLFELSPSDRFRLAMYVDEFRINDIQSHQQGDLVLSALPDEKFPFVVTRINPMTEVRDGATVYRVEAEISSAQELLRVGLEGVAQIYVDERSLVSIWTRSLRDWLKLQYWRFWG